MQSLNSGLAGEPGRGVRAGRGRPVMLRVGRNLVEACKHNSHFSSRINKKAVMLLYGIGS